MTAPYDRTIVPVAEGDGWLIVAKPPRVLVHRNKMFPRTDAMLQRVRDHVGDHVYPIHRLDRNTSGCLLFATRRELAGPLSSCLGAADARKTYVCLVRGAFEAEGEVTVETPMKVSEDVYKDACSVVDRLGFSHDPRSSLLRVRPKTGRYHQVRRHVRDLHHPIIHDGDHGDSRVNRWWRENRGVTRLSLHCLHMEIPNPHGGRIHATCPLFQDLADVWSALPYWDEAVAIEPALAWPALTVPEAQDEPQTRNPVTSPVT